MTRWRRGCAPMLVEGQIAPGAKLNERELSAAAAASRARRCARRSSCWRPKAWSTAAQPRRGGRQADRGRRASTPSRCWPGSKACRANWRPQRITDDELAEMRAMHYEMLACLRAPRPVGLLPPQRAHPHRHQRRGRATRCSTQHLPLDQRARCRRCAFAPTRTSAKWKRAVKEHERMIEALAARDAGRDAQGADRAPAPQARHRARAAARRRDLSRASRSA